MLLTMIKVHILYDGPTYRVSCCRLEYFDRSWESNHQPSLQCWVHSGEHWGTSKLTHLKEFSTLHQLHLSDAYLSLLTLASFSMSFSSAVILTWHPRSDNHGRNINIHFLVHQHPFLTHQHPFLTMVVTSTPISQKNNESNYIQHQHPFLSNM